MTNTIQTTTTGTQPGGSLARVLSVTRLHFVNKWTIVYVPVLIMAFIFLANLAVWAIIFSAVGSEEARGDVREGLSYSGASLYIFVYMLVVAVQAINLTFPFAQGYSVTRRDFYLGSSLAFVALSAAYAIGLTLLSYLEELTNGWGIGGRMFTAVYFGTGPWFERLFVFFAAFLFFFFIGAATAAVYVRWRAYGMYVFWAALALGVIGGLFLITQTRSWPAVGEWFATNGATGVLAWALLPTALAALAGYLILRRATPRE